MTKDSQKATLHYRAGRPSLLARLLEKDIGLVMMNMLLVSQGNQDICIEE